MNEQKPVQEKNPAEGRSDSNAGLGTYVFTGTVLDFVIESFSGCAQAFACGVKGLWRVLGCLCTCAHTVERPEVFN